MPRGRDASALRCNAANPLAEAHVAGPALEVDNNYIIGWIDLKVAVRRFSCGDDDHARQGRGLLEYRR